MSHKSPTNIFPHSSPIHPFDLMSSHSLPSSFPHKHSNTHTVQKHLHKDSEQKGLHINEVHPNTQYEILDTIVESPYKLDRIDTKSNDSPTFSAKLKKGLRIKQKNQKNFKELNKSLANLALKRLAGHSSIDKSATLSVGQIPSPYIIKKDLFEYNSNTSISIHKQRNSSYYIKSDYYTHRNKKNVGYSMDFAGNIITKPKKSPYRKYETQMNSVHDIHERSTKHNDFSSNSSIEMPPHRTRALFTDSKYLSENKDQHDHKKTSLSDLKPYLRAGLQHSIQNNNPRPKNGKLDQRKISSDVKYLTGGVGLCNTVVSSEGTEEDLQEGNKEDLSVTVREFNYSRVSLQEKNEKKLQKEIKRDLTKIREDIEKRKISYQEVDDFVERHFNEETMKKKEKRRSHKQSVFCYKPSTSLNKNKPHQKSKQIFDPVPVAKRLNKEKYEQSLIDFLFQEKKTSVDIRTTGNFDEPSPEDDISEKRRKSDLKQRTIKPQQSTIIEKKGINFDIGGFDVPKRVNKKFPSFS